MQTSAPFAAAIYQKSVKSQPLLVVVTFARNQGCTRPNIARPSIGSRPTGVSRRTSEPWSALKNELREVVKPNLGGALSLRRRRRRAAEKRPLRQMQSGSTEASRLPSPSSIEPSPTKGPTTDLRVVYKRRGRRVALLRINAPSGWLRPNDF